MGFFFKGIIEFRGHGEVPFLSFLNRLKIICRFSSWKARGLKLDFHCLLGHEPTVWRPRVSAVGGFPEGSPQEQPLLEAGKEGPAIAENSWDVLRSSY